MISRGFAMMDLDDDGHVTEAELMCVIEHTGCPAEANGVMNIHYLTAEHMAWIEGALEEEFKTTDELTWEKILEGIAAFEKKHKVVVSKELTDAIKALFFWSDSNNDGVVTAAEMESMANKYDD